MILLKIFSSIGAFVVVLLVTAIASESAGMGTVGPLSNLALVAAVVTWFLVPSKQKPSQPQAEPPRASVDHRTEAQPAASSPPVVTSREPAVSERSLTVTDRHWAVALSEYESGDRSAGLYARLFADCGGDETRIKAAYLKERAHSIASEESQRAFQGDGSPETELSSKKKS